MFLAAMMLALVLQDQPPQPPCVQAADVCWTLGRIVTAWPEIGDRVAFVRKTRGLPYQSINLADASIEFVEHDKAFVAVDRPSDIYFSGLFSKEGQRSPVTGQTVDRNRIDYSVEDERRPGDNTILHELGHYLYFMQMKVYGEQGDASGYFDHGIAQDPVVQALNALIVYLYPLPHEHPYFPGLLPSLFGKPLYIQAGPLAPKKERRQP